jgi:hypothetical protein
MERENIEQAIEATRKILDRYGFHYENVEILHCSNNLVLILQPLPIIAKVTTAISFRGTDPNLELTVASHLQTRNVPSVAPSTVLPVQVHAKDGYQVTFWDYFEGEAIEAPDRNQSLTLMQKLHEALASFRYEKLPRFEAKLDDCIGSLDQASCEMPDLPERDRLFLSRILKELNARLNGSSTKVGIIHGDCRPHNLIWNNQGMAKWIDFEAVCLGPVAWDYLSFFGREDEILKPFSNVVEILSDITHGCVATWCWSKKDRGPKNQEAAEYHLEQLKRKYSVN